MRSSLRGHAGRGEWQDRHLCTVFCHHGRVRDVAVLVHGAVRVFDLAVVHEVFGVRRSSGQAPRFDLWRCGTGRRAIDLDGGLTVRPDHGLAALARADLILVPGTDRPYDPVPAPVARALRAAAANGVPVAAMCAGAFTVAGAGLLDGRRATTHWSLVADLAHRYPAVRVENGPLWIEDGPVWTSAGTAAGIDLCLHLVRRWHGAAAATSIARSMVTPPHRDGGQAQYVERAVEALPDTFAEVLAWARDHLDRPLTVPVLARRARMSERTFARRFADTTGTTPLRWLHHQRVQYAQELLERTDLPVEEVARRAGFGGTAVLRRHFGRDVGTTPTAYRQRFAA
jgi:transcriptional regulator GlxA family with amidase domain